MSLDHTGPWISLCTHHIPAEPVARVLQLPAALHHARICPFCFPFLLTGNIAQVLFNSAGHHPLWVLQDSLAQQWLLLLSNAPHTPPPISPVMWSDLRNVQPPLEYTVRRTVGLCLPIPSTFCFSPKLVK